MSTSLTWAFEAAQRAGYRGYFWFPSLDPQVQMVQWSRDIIARKINWLYNNVPALRAVVDGLAIDEVDTGLWPKPATSSPAFNIAVKTAFRQQCQFHKAFSADGENNYFSSQLLVRRELRLRGDCFAQKLRAGEAASCPQMHFLPSYQCTDSSAKDGFRDGRLNNKFRRAVKWRFADDEQFSRFRDVDAADVIHFHDPFLIGQTRGISELAPVVKHLFSIDDIYNAETGGVLLRASMAYAVERSDMSDTGPTLIPGATLIETQDQPDGSKLYVQRLQVNNATDIRVADMPPGRTMKVVESNKSAESASWSKELLAAVAYCTKYPPDYIFALAGFAQGTAVRLAQGKVQRVLNTIRDFQIAMQHVDEWWPFWLWQNIAGGTFDRMNVRGGVPDDWWKYNIVVPKDISVDTGRDGRLYDDRVSRGLMPVGLYSGMIYGKDEDEMDDAVIRDAYRRRKRNQEIASEMQADEIPIDQIFRPPPGTAAPVAAADTTDPTETEETEEETPDADAAKEK